MSWEGQILCCYDIITMPGAPPRGGGGPGSRSRPGSIPFGGMGASSMSFNDTLQVTVESESAVFFLLLFFFNCQERSGRCISKRPLNPSRTAVSFLG